MYCDSITAWTVTVTGHLLTSRQLSLISSNSRPILAQQAKSTLESVDYRPNDGECGRPKGRVGRHTGDFSNSGMLSRQLDLHSQSRSKAESFNFL